MYLEFDGEYTAIPLKTQIDLINYVNKKNSTGGFLDAVLRNDLMGAVLYADSGNIRAISAIVRFVYNRLPVQCWGSTEKINEWLSSR